MQKESDGVTEDEKNEQIKSIKKRIQDISDAKKYEKYDMNDDKHKTYRYNGEYYVDDRKTRTDITIDVNNSTGSLTQAFAVLRKELKKKDPSLKKSRLMFSPDFMKEIKK